MLLTQHQIFSERFHFLEAFFCSTTNTQRTELTPFNKHISVIITHFCIKIRSFLEWYTTTARPKVIGLHKMFSQKHLTCTANISLHVTSSTSEGESRMPEDSTDVCAIKNMRPLVNNNRAPSKQAVVSKS